MNLRSGAKLLAASVAAVILVAAASACDGEPSAPPLTPAAETPPAATAPSTPTPTPTAEATPTPSPIHAPSPTPTASPSPTPTATPSPTPTATPSPTPTATPAPQLTAEDLAIREVDVAETLAAAGLTHVRYEAGEEVPWDPGLFLLDTASGAVEGWVRSLASVPEEERELRAKPPDISVSPSGRFLDLHGVLYDRQTGRGYRVDGMPLDRWWGAGADERLLFWASRVDAFVMLDGDFQPVAQFQIPPGERFTSATGGYILVRAAGSSGTFHLVNLEDESNPRVHTWVLPWEPVPTKEWGPAYRIELLDDLVAFVGSGGDFACHVTRYDLRGALLSDQTIPCRLSWLDHWAQTGVPRISPDGRLVAAVTLGGLGEFGYGRQPVGAVMSIFDAATGTEAVRLLGVHPRWIPALDVEEDAWLADSSGIIVQTRDGERVAGLDATWGPAPGWASPDDPDLFLVVDRPMAVNQQGDVLASLSFGPPSAAIPDPPYDATLTLWTSVGWGARSDTLQVRTSFFHTQEFDDYRPMPPFAPVIERPPFGDRLLVEVLVDTCLNVREEHQLDAPIVTCLPNGAVAETDDFYQGWESSWMHIRTDDGLEGWAHADYLRWHSDGVRLEE